MNVASYIFGIVSAVVTLAVVIEMLRRRKLRERHAIWWFVAGILALIIGVFPKVLEWAAHLVGIQVPTNLVFFVSIFILFLVSIQHSSELTQVEDRNRNLAEKVALLEQRIRKLESEPAEGSDPREVIAPRRPEDLGRLGHEARENEKRAS